MGKTESNMGEKTDKPHNKKITKEIILPTLCLILVFFILGAGFSLLGPTLVHLRYLYSASISQMSLTFTFFAGGYLLGSILCGVVFDRFNKELQFFITCMAIGLLAIVTPWIPSIYGFFIFVLFFATAMGYLDSTGQPYTITLWEGHRLKGPIVQLLYSIWTIGNFAGPFAVGPFLVDLPKDDASKNCTSVVNGSNVSYDVNSTNTGCVNLHNNSSESGDIQIPGLERVRIPYSIIGIAMCVSSFSFIAVYFVTRKSPKSHESVSTKEENEKKEEKKEALLGDDMFFRVVLLTLQFFFCLFLISSVGSLNGLLSAFVIEGLKWSVDKGPLISSTFMGAQAFIRIVAIPTSALLSPTIILTFNVITATVAMVMMSFVEYAGSYLMWISTALIGIGLGTTFPTAMLWTSSFMQMTGRVGSIFFIGGSVGIMGSTALAGYLFENYSHMWVVYMSLITCSLDVLLFCAMFVFVKCYQRKRGKLVLETAVNGKEMQPLNTEKA